MKNRIFLVFAILALCSCANTPPQMSVMQTSAGNVHIAPDCMLTLPQPGDLGRRVEATQLVTAHFGGQSLAFEGHISANADHLLFVGLDLMGRKAISIDWTKTGITYASAPWVPAQLQPQNILADMVLLYWPEAIIRKSLVPSGGSLFAIGNRRTVLVNDKEIMRAEYQPASGNDLWSGRIHYRNLVWGYELDIQSTESNP